jgi:lysophospholipase L1-like esterase
LIDKDYVDEAIASIPAGPQGPMGPSGYSGAAEDLEVVQVSGDSVTAVMSQKAVADAIPVEVAEQSDSQFDISDENGYVLAQFKDGHIITKKFNSEVDAPTSTSDTAADFEISDRDGNVLVRFKNGHIITKNFDSANIDVETLASKFKNKRMAIIGDSISTFEGTMPTGYVTYYPAGDIQNVDDTYWMKIVNGLDMTVTNCAWSGSTTSGDSSSDNNAFAACSNKRINDLGRDGNPDIVLCYIGINDFNTSVPIGTWDCNTAIPSDGNITTFSDAYALMIWKIYSTYPRARVFCCTLPDDVKHDKPSIDGYPSLNNNGDSVGRFNNKIREIANALGADVIELQACGINYANIDTFTSDNIHPNKEGHLLFSNKIKIELISKY